jgi:hypothetical protein
MNVVVRSPLPSGLLLQEVEAVARTIRGFRVEDVDVPGGTLRGHLPSLGGRITTVVNVDAASEGSAAIIRIEGGLLGSGARLRARWRRMLEEGVQCRIERREAGA